MAASVLDQVGGISVDRGGLGERQVILSCEAAGAKITNISFAAYGYDAASRCSCAHLLDRDLSINHDRHRSSYPKVHRTEECIVA